MNRIRIRYGALVLLVAGICICGCVTDDDDAYSRASSLYERAGIIAGEINWGSEPPELINAKLQEGEVNLNEALVIVEGIQPDPESEEPSAAYGLRELILGKMAYVSAAREVAEAQAHILNAEDAAEIYQYNDWYVEMHAAQGNLELARMSLSVFDTRMDGVNMALVPVDMRSEIAESKILNANLDILIGSLDQSIELALDG